MQILQLSSLNIKDKQAKVFSCAKINNQSYSVAKLTDVLYGVFQKSWAHFDNEYLGNYYGYRNASGKFRKLCNLNFYMEYSKMFNVSTIGHSTQHQTDSPICAKRVPALHCQWLQQLLLFVPLAHPDLTPCDFFLGGFVKRLVYVPPIPRDVDELKA